MLKLEDLNSSSDGLEVKQLFESELEKKGTKNKKFQSNKDNKD